MILFFYDCKKILKYLFLNSEDHYNSNYITFTRFCKGFAKKFLKLLHLDLELNFENEPYENVKYKIESYISNYKQKAILYIFRYLKESVDKRK